MYDHKAIERKWRKRWEEEKTFRCDTHDFSKPKFYALDMFPFPSGQGLHVGHPEGYTASDIVARMKRMQGYNVLHPMGWDAFGLPAEQYAIEHNEHPEISTRRNIDHFREQIKSLGMSIDWDREISTIDPSYYKWTQWIFCRLFEHDLAYLADVPVNFCPELGTVLANEEVIDGKSERGGYPVVRIPMRQWMLRITRYADRLEKDLEGLDWPRSTIEMQKNWIGRSTGVEILFKIKGSEESFRVYTTRVDTLYGCTYCCLAPEHPLVKKLATPECREEVERYVKESAKKSDLARTALSKEKTGVPLGIFAINPINGKEVPVYVADYVLGSYGTGAVMAVPAHDQRDYEFAKAHGLPIVQVLEGDVSERAMEEDAPHVHSGEADGLLIEDAKKVIARKLKEMGAGEEKVNYKLRDWLFSRQRYWGEPIPVVRTEDGEERVLPDEELPLVLPELGDYTPRKDGKPPLSKAPDSWLHVEIGGKKGERETNTMPQWAGSCWYYIRYIDPHNENAIGEKELLDHWLPVDLYIGGQEHAVLHLLYARFWHKFLHDIGVLSSEEPFQRLFHQGMILGANGEKMSKSRGNVVNPDEIVETTGADSLRLFEMFAGPLSDSKPWSTEGLRGARRFIERAFRLVDGEEERARWSEEDSGELSKAYHQMVKKCTEDFESLDFNTGISSMMVFVNECYKARSLYRPYLEGFAKIFSCVCPFAGEEMWERLGHRGTIAYEKWPSYDEKALQVEEVKVALQVNGKLRDVLLLRKDASEEEAKEAAFGSEKAKPFLEGKTLRKFVYVPGKIVNVVVS